jgi:hypothetical protein
MLNHLKRRFDNRARQFDPTGIQMESCSADELVPQILEITQAVLRKAGVDLACVSLRVEQAGTTKDGRALLRSMVELVRWESTAAMRLFLGVGHIERAVRRAVEASWVADSCQFAGVWLHPGDAILESANLKQLSSMLSRCDTGFANSGESGWASVAPPAPPTVR